MNTYTLTAPELGIEALEVGLEKIANTAKEFALVAKIALMLVGGPLIGLAFVIALPVIVIFVVLQRYIVAGLTEGATKG